MQKSSIRKWCFGITGSLVLLSSSLVRAGEIDKVLPTEAIEQIVHDYLLHHPEVISKSLDTFRAQQQAAQQQLRKDAVVARRTELLEDPTSPVAGAETASVEVVEFFDYRCGYCKRVHATVLNLLAQYPNVRLIFKEFPILGPDSDLAAKAALAAAKQGGYLPMHEALMGLSTAPLTTATIEVLVAKLGLDLALLNAEMESPEIAQSLRRNHDLAAALSIQSTPTFVIGGDVLPGALDAATFANAIAKAEAMQKAEVPPPTTDTRLTRWDIKGQTGLR